MRMQCIVLLVFFTIVVASVHSCSPCNCSEIRSGKWKSLIKADCTSMRNLTSIPATLDNNIQVLLFDDQALVLLEDNDFYFHNLQVLRLRRNYINSINEFAFKDMISLREISLGENEIITLPTNVFAKTPNLQKLWLYNNKIVVLQENLFSNLRNLKEIYLQNNQISSIQINCFVEVPLLQTINLSNNNMTSLHVNMMDDTSSLRRLDLAGNPWHCDDALCELMDAALDRAWVHGPRGPQCATPDQTMDKLWTDLPQDFAPAILPDTRIIEVEEGGNITLYYRHCFASKLRCYNLTSYKITGGRDQALVLRVNVAYDSPDTEGSYFSCSIDDCALCKEGYVLLRTKEKYVLGSLTRQDMCILILLMYISTVLIYVLLKRLKKICRAVMKGKKLTFPRNDDREVIQMQTYNTGNAITEDNSTNLEQNAMTPRSSSEKEDEQKQDGICSTIFGLVITVAFCILYIADVYSDISLAIFFYLHGVPKVALMIVFILYASSLLTAIFERRTRTMKGIKYYFIAVLIFILNISGILIFKDILKIRWKKVKLAVKKYPIDPSDNELLNRKIRDLAFLKAIEAFTENLPVMIIQMYYRVIPTGEVELKLSEIEGLPFVISYIAFITTIVGFVNNVPDEKVLSKWANVLKYLWLLFVTIAKANANTYILFAISWKFAGLILLHYFLYARFVYKNTIDDQIMNGDQVPMKKDWITSFVYGCVFMFAPYLYTGKKSFYNTSAVTVAHVLYFVELLTLSYSYTYNLKVDGVEQVVYFMFVVSFFSLGFLCFFAFKSLKCTKTLFS